MGTQAGVPCAPYPDEVAHCHRGSNCGCGGARGLTAVGGGENAEHELEGQDELYRHRLAGRGTAPDLCRAGGSGVGYAGASGLCPGMVSPGPSFLTVKGATPCHRQPQDLRS